MMIARLSLLNSLPRLASMAPFLCLIVAQWECPDMVPPGCQNLGIRNSQSERPCSSFFESLIPDPSSLVRMLFLSLQEFQFILHVLAMLVDFVALACFI